MKLHAPAKQQPALWLPSGRVSTSTASCWKRPRPQPARSRGALQPPCMQVHALEPLVSSERYELACNAQGRVQGLATPMKLEGFDGLKFYVPLFVSGFVHFPAGERVITQGKVRQARLWPLSRTKLEAMTQTVVDGSLNAAQVCDLCWQCRHATFLQCKACMTSRGQTCRLDDSWDQAPFARAQELGSPRRQPGQAFRGPRLAPQALT